MKEILSPAGNMDYIKVAINNKVGAVYGGFKFLNARNRAVNFTIEEYNKAILLVHENGIKFYLTLNVLLVDEELESLVDLLLSGTVLLPDAFIVADIGLITRLNKTFPNVAIHLSTQFGCHNIYDVKYAYSLHADRVILSRELTKEEIEHITDQSPIEIECFCWGSQCISFSGMCFWGALLNGGGGNNGKCLIPCRDIYEVGNRSGNMLYLSDLNCVNEIKKIERVVSYKIEGRRRPSKEVEAAIMNVIEGTKDKENGFIFGTDNKQNGLLQTMNARLKPVCKAKDMIPDRYDKFAIFKEGKPVRYCDYEDNEDCFYIHSGLFKKYDLNKDNVSFSLIVEERCITGISYTNWFTDEVTFSCKSTCNLIFHPEEFVNSVNRISDNINVYSVLYRKENAADLLISEELINEVIAFITNAIGKEVPAKKQNKVKKLYIESNDESIIDDLLEFCEDDIIINLDSTAKLRNVDHYISKYAIFSDRIIYKLPVFNWEGIDLLPYYLKLENYQIMFTRLSQLYLTKDIKFKRKISDYTIYLWNREALQYISQYQIDSFTASVELDYVTNHKVFEYRDVQYIIGGKLPLIYSRNCFSDLFGCHCNDDKVKTIHNQDKDLDFELICNEDYRFFVTKEIMINNFSRENSYESFRYMSYGQKISEIHLMIKALKKSNYYKDFSENKDKFYSLK